MEQREVLLGIRKTFGGKQFLERDGGGNTSLYEP